MICPHQSKNQKSTYIYFLVHRQSSLCPLEPQFTTPMVYLKSAPFLQARVGLLALSQSGTIPWTDSPEMAGTDRSAEDSWSDSDTIVDKHEEQDGAPAAAGFFILFGIDSAFFPSVFFCRAGPHQGPLCCNKKESS